LEAVAAVLAVAVSLLAAGAFLLRSPEPGRVESGAIRVDGSPAVAFDVGQSLECDAAARLRLKDGPAVDLDPGAAGTFVEAGRFDLRRGGGAFTAGPPLRVVAPEASVSAAGASFSARLDARGLRVAVASGSVEVDYDGLRHPLRAGESVRYLPLAGRKAGPVKAPGEAAFDLAAALAKVEGTAVGAALEREDGRTAYAVRVIRGGKLREVTLDATTGAVLEDDVEAGDRTAVAAKISLRDAIAAALAKVPGVALEADADGRAFAEIDLLSNGRRYEVTVDLATGAVISLGPETP
ncbi:MAG TPA: PepSY domain-containing protein, partial [Planctomycetota bacterium]